MAQQDFRCYKFRFFFPRWSLWSEGGSGARGGGGVPPAVYGHSKTSLPPPPPLLLPPPAHSAHAAEQLVPGCLHLGSISNVAMMQCLNRHFAGPQNATGGRTGRCRPGRASGHTSDTAKVPTTLKRGQAYGVPVCYGSPCSVAGRFQGTSVGGHNGLALLSCVQSVGRPEVPRRGPPNERVNICLRPPTHAWDRVWKQGPQPTLFPVLYHALGTCISVRPQRHSAPRYSVSDGLKTRHPCSFHPSLFYPAIHCVLLGMRLSKHVPCLFGATVPALTIPQRSCCGCCIALRRPLGLHGGGLDRMR